MKDVPTEESCGTCIPRDNKTRGRARLPDFSRRREVERSRPWRAPWAPAAFAGKAQLRHHRPDLELLDLRGNVDTRLKKVAAGEFDAIVLATAGLNRLGVSEQDYADSSAGNHAARRRARCPRN